MTLFKQLSRAFVVIVIFIGKWTTKRNLTSNISAHVNWHHHYIGKGRYNRMRVFLSVSIFALENKRLEKSHIISTIHIYKIKNLQNHNKNVDNP